MKQIKLNTRNVAILSLFLMLLFGSCSSNNDSMGTDIPDNPKPSDVKVMDKAEIVDYSKYYCPAKWNEGFEKGPDNMLRSDARWSWWRMKQSEHFFVFWEPGFGDDPNAESALGKSIYLQAGIAMSGIMMRPMMSNGLIV